jgi:HPt (histidine-containing phosphotransfer) domain-containing protein
MEQPNSKYIDELSGNDAIFKQKIITILKTELPQEIESYKNCMTSKNYKATAEMVHKLKHKISVLGLEKSYYLGEKFEENLKENSLDLQPEFEEILALMQSFVDDL